jgi:hypothetical protein
MDADGGEFGLRPVAGRARFASPDGRGGRFRTSIVASGVRPYASQARHALCGNSEVGAAADQDFFESADEFNYA